MSIQRSSYAGAVVACCALLSVIAPKAAYAQTDNRVAAEDLFQQARKLLDAGRYAEACEKLASSQHLDPAVGTLLNLARCYEKMGRTASAWETYRETMAAARRAGQAERERIARHEANVLESKLSRLTIQVTRGSSDSLVTITRDGIAVNSDLWGVAVAIDPGDHVLIASAPGSPSWTQTVHVDPAASQVVTVPLLAALAPQASEPAPAAPAPAAVSEEAPPPRPTAPEKPTSSSHWNTQKTLAVIAAGLAIASGAVATVELLDYENKKSQSTALCPGSCTDPTNHTNAVTLLTDAESHENIGIAAAAAGGAALIGAVVLWLTSGDPSPSTNATNVPRTRDAAPHFVPVAVPDAVGVRFVGAF